MDAEQIRKLKPELRRYLSRFDDCFSRRDTRAHFGTYVEGQLSDLKEKSCEPMALAAGVPPRNLQEFLGAYRWDEDLARERLQQMVAREDRGPHGIGIIDETSDVKQGKKTPGVQRQLKWTPFSRPQNRKNMLALNHGEYPGHPRTRTGLLFHRSPMGTIHFDLGGG